MVLFKKKWKNFESPGCFFFWNSDVLISKRFEWILRAPGVFFMWWNLGGPSVFLFRRFLETPGVLFWQVYERNVFVFSLVWENLRAPRVFLIREILENPWCSKFYYDLKKKWRLLVFFLFKKFLVISGVFCLKKFVKFLSCWSSFFLLAKSGKTLCCSSLWTK